MCIVDEALQQGNCSGVERGRPEPHAQRPPRQRLNSNGVRGSGKLPDGSSQIKPAKRLRVFRSLQKICPISHQRVLKSNQEGVARRGAIRQLSPCAGNVALRRYWTSSVAHSSRCAGRKTFGSIRQYPRPANADTREPTHRAR